MKIGIIGFGAIGFDVAKKLDQEKDQFNVIGVHSRTKNKIIDKTTSFNSPLRYFSLDEWFSKNIKQLPEPVQQTFPFMIVPKASKSEKNEGLDNFDTQQVLKEEKEVPEILVDINCTFSPGQFSVIIGKVGCGKSSLICACIQEMVKNKGYVKRNGKIAYIPQEAFHYWRNPRQAKSLGSLQDRRREECSSKLFKI